MSDHDTIPTTDAIPAEERTSIPAGWWQRLDAEEARLNEEIRQEAARLHAEADPAEIERLVALAVPIVKRLMEKYRR